MIISTIILTIISSYLYRFGGMGSEEFNKKFPYLPDFLHDKLVRRIGCMLVAVIWLMVTISPNLISLFISAGLMYGALTTYNDWLAPDGSSENWRSWAATGALYSLATFPLLWCGIAWYAFLTRTVVLSLSILFCREFSSNADFEEYSTGALFIITLPLLLL